MDRVRIVVAAVCAFVGFARYCYSDSVGTLNICSMTESQKCDLDGTGGQEPIICRYGCFNQQNGVGDCQDDASLSRYFSTHADPMWAWLPPDFPPITLDAFDSTAPLVSGETRHFQGPMPYATRPTDRGVIDLATGSRLLREVDFELPFGSAVFRHVRTNSDSILMNQGSSTGGGWSKKAKYLADWNGNWWMMSENPLFLFDADPVYNLGLPRVCYFIPDAHRAIPFVWDSDSLRYIAPPWIDARLEYTNGVWGNGVWATPPTEFKVYLQRGSIIYTIELFSGMMPDCFKDAPGSAAWNEFGGERGVPTMGRVTKIEDRYGNVVEYTYCNGGGDSGVNGQTTSCTYHCGEESCDTQCDSCNEAGQLKAIKLRRRIDGSSGSLATVWTLLYTHRAFGYYCDYCTPTDPCDEGEIGDACSPPEGCVLSGLPDFDFGTTRSRPHMLHSIHVFEGDVDIPTECLTLPYEGFCVAESLDYSDTINHSRVDEIVAQHPWSYEARYLYDEFNDRWGRNTCPSVCLYSASGAVGYSAADPADSGNPDVSGGDLLKTTISRRMPGGNVDTRSSIYRYYANYDSEVWFVLPDHVGLAILDDTAIRAILEGERSLAPSEPKNANWLLGLKDGDSVHVIDPETAQPMSIGLGSMIELRFGVGGFGLEGSLNSDIASFVNWYHGTQDEIEHTFAVSRSRTLLDKRESNDAGTMLHYYHMQQYPIDCPPPMTGPRRIHNHSAAEEIKYPFRYRVDPGHACATEPFRRLMADLGGGRRFHIMIIDEEDNDDATTYNHLTTTVPSEPPNNDSHPKGVRTRRMVEMNAAGFVLRDRTWSYEKNPNGDLIAHSGYGVDQRLDCAGRVVEKRSIGWSAGHNLGTGFDPASQGLIEVIQYDDGLDSEEEPIDYCHWSTSLDRCDCSQVTVPDDVTLGEVKAIGIKEGTAGSIYLVQEYVRHPDRPALISKRIDYPLADTTPVHEDGDVTEYRYVFDSSTPISEARIIERHVIRPAAPGSLGGPQRYAVEKQFYGESGNMLWRATGSLVDPDSTTPVAGDELFVDRYIFDPQGRPTDEIIDFGSGTDSPPAGYTRQAQADPLNLLTERIYDSVYGLTGVNYPNGRKDRYAYVKDEDNDALYQWFYKDLLWDGSSDFKALSPVQISYIKGSELEWTKLVNLPDPDTNPDGDEEYSEDDVVTDAKLSYDEHGKIVGVSQGGAHVDSNAEPKAKVSYSAFGGIDRQQDPSGTISRMVYDQRGRLKKTYRGTTDQHAFWGTADLPQDPCDTPTYDDNLVLIEKRYYGESVNDADRLTSIRRFDNKPTNQYFEVIDSEECPNLPDPGDNDEDGIGRLEVHQYDWRMRDVWVEFKDENGNSLRHSLTWLDNLNRVRFTAEYGPNVATESGINPAYLSASGSDISAATILGSDWKPVSLTENVYNGRGQVEETRRYNVAYTTGSMYLSSFTFLNHRDQPVEVVEPNSGRMQYVYDAKGRRIKSLVMTPNSSGTPVEQSRTDSTYDEDDREIKTIRLVRHDLTGTGMLDATNAVITYTYSWYDKAGRLIAMADFGTGNATYTTTSSSTVPEYASILPFETEDDLDHSNCPAGALCTFYKYDEGGRQDEVIGPDQTVRRQEFDGLGRLLLSVENAGAPNKNDRRVTAYKYDESGRLRSIAAVLPGYLNLTNGVTEYDDISNWSVGDGSMQVTQLIYKFGEVVGTDEDATTISLRNDWVHTVRYPDSETGLPSDTDILTFKYLSDGRVAERVDQRGVIISYKYDDLGRRIETEINDDAWYTSYQSSTAPLHRINRIEYDYSYAGAPMNVEAYSGVSSPQLVAHNLFGYDNFQNLTQERQAHFGTAGAYTPSVDYDWDTSAGAEVDHYNRLERITYPTRPGTSSRRQVTFDYGSSSGTPDHALNRITDITVSGLSPSPAASYTYNGGSRRVAVGLGCGLYQSLVGANGYTGLDGFGRLLDLNYKRISNNTTVQQYLYGYDAAGNRTHGWVDQEQWNAYAHDNDRSFLYEYDGLHRLISAEMGALADDNQSIRPGPTTEHPDDPIRSTVTWSLDNLGNWSGAPATYASVIRTGDFDNDGVLESTPPDTTTLHHEVDAANVLERVRENGNVFAPTLVTDWSGNLIYDGDFVYQYDGLNRLVQVNEKGTAEFEMQGLGNYTGRIASGTLGALVFRHVYDGLGRIIRKEIPEPGFTPLRTEDYYYDGLRRVQDVEKRPYEPFEPCEFFPVSVKGQLVLAAEDPELEWLNAAGAPIEPVDPCELEPEHSQSGPTYETWCEREYVYGPDQLDEFVLQIDRTGNPYYILQDASLNVVGIYGSGNGNPVPPPQMQRQDIYAPYGDVVATDYFFSAFDNRVGHHGMFVDRLTTNTYDPQLAAGAKSLYRYRNRTYSPTLGKFLQRDPNAAGAPLIQRMTMMGEVSGFNISSTDILAHYRDGINIFNFTENSPINQSDPLGAFAIGSYADILGSTAIRTGLFALNVGGGISSAVNFADTALFGAGVYQATLELLAESLITAVGGKAFDSALDAAKGVAKALTKGTDDIAKASSKIISLKVLQGFCFVENTIVAMADGTTKPIQAVVPGDLVACAIDPTSKRCPDSCEVRGISRRLATTVNEVLTNSGDLIMSTVDHPYFTVSINDYVPADELADGTELFSLDQSAITVVSRRTLSHQSAVYNLQIASAHNYFVSGSPEHPFVLVHNGCFDRRKLQHVFGRHADDFGFAGKNWSNKIADEFETAISAHINKSELINGTYRGTIRGKHFVDPNSKLWVFLDEADQLVAGFKLSDEQFQYLKEIGNVQ